MVATLPSQNTTWLEVLLQLGQLKKSRFQSYNGEISVGSYGFTLGKYTEQAAELLLDTGDWVVKIPKNRVAAFALELWVWNRSNIHTMDCLMSLLWLGLAGQTFAQANVDKQDLQPSAPHRQLRVQNFMMRLMRLFDLESILFTHLYPNFD